jgi:AraC-like DNA-binding protein
VTVPDLATRSLVPKGMVRMAPTMAVPAVLREHGVDPVPLLAEFGLTPRQFEEPDYTIAFETRARLLARCAKVTRCPHFGLLVGQRGGLASFGVIGYLMQSAPDARTALRLVVRNFQLHNPNSTCVLTVDHDFATFSHSILDAGVEGYEQVLDLAVGIMVNAVHATCGHQVHPTEVRIAHARPRSVAPYVAMARSPVIFDSPDTAVVMPAYWLDRPLPGADPVLHLLMQHRVADLVAQSSEGTANQLRRVLPSLVESGSTTAGEAAGRLGLGVRTMNRRLAKEGTSFAQLRDEARHSIARQLLEGTRLQAREIAAKLGYANPGAFTAAFRRWSGRSPAEWRAQASFGAPAP